MPIPEQCRSLTRGQALLCENARDLHIVCRQGRLWLTQYGDSRDIVLESGDSFIADSGSVLIISALLASQVSLSRQRPAPSSRPGRVWQRLAQWLGQRLNGRWQSAANAHFRRRFQSARG